MARTVSGQCGPRRRNRTRLSTDLLALSATPRQPLLRTFHRLVISSAATGSPASATGTHSGGSGPGSSRSTSRHGHGRSSRFLLRAAVLRVHLRYRPDTPGGNLSTVSRDITRVVSIGLEPMTSSVSRKRATTAPRDQEQPAQPGRTRSRPSVPRRRWDSNPQAGKPRPAAFQAGYHTHGSTSQRQTKRRAAESNRCRATRDLPVSSRAPDHSGNTPQATTSHRPRPDRPGSPCRCHP